MSDIQDWAEREIEIACRCERATNENPNGTEWDYGCACYESALKAFKSLMEDGHSGVSIGVTRHILNRLIDSKPLTPIEDTPDIWNNISESEDSEVLYQCKRMSSLFKYVYPDGTVKYNDTDRCYGIDLNDNTPYYSGLVNHFINDLITISMPYTPTDPIKVYTTSILTDRKNGDYDTIGIFYAIQPDGSRIEINRFFKEGKDDWIEIDEDEYHLRKEIEDRLLN